MDIQSLILAGITLSIFLTVLSIGMRMAPGDLQCVLSNPPRLARALLAMNILGPIVTIAICKTFSLHPAVIVGLVTLSIAPINAMFSKAMLPLVAPSNPAYARGLFFASTVLSVVLTPLPVEVIQRLFGEGEVVHLSPLLVAQVVIGSVLLPLGIGLAIGRWRAVTRNWVPSIQKASGVVLLVCAIPIVVGAWPHMPALVRRRGGRALEPAARRASRHRLRAAAARHRPGDRTLAPCYAQLGAGHSESERGRASRLRDPHRRRRVAAHGVARARRHDRRDRSYRADRACGWALPRRARGRRSHRARVRDGASSPGRCRCDCASHG